LILVLAQAAAADVLLAHALDVQVRGSGGEFGTVGTTLELESKEQNRAM